MSRSIVINFILFQLGWFACVLGGAHDQVLAGIVIASAVIAYHLYRVPGIIKELQLLILALFIGAGFESLVTLQQLASYSHGQPLKAVAPFWMILMWPLFATTLNLSMRWLKRLNLLLVALLGAVFAPLAYYAGSRLGAVVYHDQVISLSVIAMAWAMLLPTLVHASIRLDGYRHAGIKLHVQRYAGHV